MVQEERKLRINNISDKPTRLDFNPTAIKRLILLPDYSPINSSLPVGSIAVYGKDNHKINPSHLGQDMGCGMLLGIIKNFHMERIEDIINNVAGNVLYHRNYDKLGYLGSGNHFITLYGVKESKDPRLNLKDILILIHSGSGKKGIDLYKNNQEFNIYFERYKEVLEYARKNRKAILEIFKKYSKSNVEILFDKVHNSIEVTNEEIIYRKGAVKVMPGEYSVISSSMSGDALIVSSKESIRDLDYSLPHGTGRKVPRSEAHEKMFFLDGFPKSIYVPYFLYAENLNGELPPCYRTLEDILPKLEPFIEAKARISPISSIMS